MREARPSPHAGEVGLARGVAGYGGALLSRGEKRRRRKEQARSEYCGTTVHWKGSVLGNGVFHGGGEHFSAIFGEHYLTARGVEGPILGAKARYGDHVTRLDGIFGDAAALEHSRRGSGKTPRGQVAVVTLGVHVKPDMRILPLDLAHDAGHLDGLGFIVFGGEGMMRQSRHAGEQQAGCEGRDSGCCIHRFTPGRHGHWEDSITARSRPLPGASSIPRRGCWLLRPPEWPRGPSRRARVPGNLPIRRPCASRSFECAHSCSGNTSYSRLWRVSSR